MTSHAQAAGEFAKAAESTINNEAIRVLRLLESHHNKLGELLQFSKENGNGKAGMVEEEKDGAKGEEVKAEDDKPVSTSAAVAELRAKSRDATNQRQHDVMTTSILTRRTGAGTFPRRMPPREMSSSIASNLASARGIRSAPAVHALSPSLTATDAQGAMGPPPRRRPNSSNPSNPNSPRPAGIPSWLPPTPIPCEDGKDAAVRAARSGRRDDSRRTSRTDRTETTLADSAGEHARDAQATLAEEGFAKFYSAFESLKSKLSAPLAFAGLPLISEEEPPSSQDPAPVSSPRSGAAKRTSSLTNEPDLAKYFSRAAIKASLTTSQAAVNDSFYVVPTSGGSISYAAMVGYTPNQNVDSPPSAGEDEGECEDEEGEEDFVDAREHPSTPNRTSFRHSSSATLKTALSRKPSAAGTLAGGKTAEELALENTHLKKTLDAAATALEAEKLKLRKYQMESQAGTMAVHNLLAESGVLPRSGAGSVSNSIHSSKGTGASGGAGGLATLGASVFGALAGVREQSTGVDVEVLRKEIDGLRADYGKEKRLRRKLESDAQKERVEMEKERNEAAREVERVRKEMETFRGDALKYRQLEKNAREKAERRRKEARSDRIGANREADGKGRDDMGSKAADGARFVSG